MTQPRFNDPPDPPKGLSWCQACLYREKGRLLRRIQAETAKLLNDGNETAEKWFAWPADAKLYPARYRGVNVEYLQLGQLDLCFSCLAGIEVEAVSALDPRRGGSIQLPPGFQRGIG